MTEQIYDSRFRQQRCTASQTCSRRETAAQLAAGARQRAALRPRSQRAGEAARNTAPRCAPRALRRCGRQQRHLPRLAPAFLPGDRTAPQCSWPGQQLQREMPGQLPLIGATYSFVCGRVLTPGCVVARRWTRNSSGTRCVGLPHLPLVMACLRIQPGSPHLPRLSQKPGNLSQRASSACLLRRCSYGCSSCSSCCTLNWGGSYDVCGAVGAVTSGATSRGGGR